MAMIAATEEYYIATDYMSAIINGDYSGLSEEDEERLDTWLDGVYNVPEYQDCHVVFDVADQGDEFAKDSVTGLMALCAKLIVNYMQ